MTCNRCKVGNVLVFTEYVCESTYKQDENNEWKEEKPAILEHNELYSRCDYCRAEYKVNEYQFYKHGNIQVCDARDVKVEIQLRRISNPIIKIFEDDNRIFELLESLGWVVLPPSPNLLPTPEAFVKTYRCPSGNGLFGELDIPEAEKLKEATEKALSDNGIPYYTRKLTFLDDDF